MNDAMIKNLAEVFDSFTVNGNQIRLTSDYGITQEKVVCIQMLLEQGFAVTLHTRKPYYTISQMREEYKESWSTRMWNKILG